MLDRLSKISAAVAFCFNLIGCDAQPSATPSAAPSKAGLEAPPGSQPQPANAELGAPPGVRTLGIPPAGAATPAAPIAAAEPVVEDPSSDFGEKTEDDARDFLDRAIADLLSDGEAKVSGERDFNPKFVRVFSHNPIRSATVRAVRVLHVVKLRKGEFCPQHRGNNFLLHLEATGEKGTEELILTINFLSDEDKANDRAYRRKNGFPESMPYDADWRVLKESPLISGTYVENVRKINEMRRGKN